MSLARLSIVTDAYAWICAVNPFEPEEAQYCPTRDVLAGRLVHCRKDALHAGMTEQQSFLFQAVLGEIGNNAYDHNLGAWSDIPGTLFRWEEQSGFFVAVIADRGQGVRATLKRVKPSITTNEEALKVAFLEKLSGRAPERRGNGLKFVRKVLLEDSIDLLFHSGDCQYVVLRKKEQWQATQIAVSGCLAVISWTMP